MGLSPEIEKAIDNATPQQLANMLSIGTEDPEGPAGEEIYPGVFNQIQLARYSRLREGRDNLLRAAEELARDPKLSKRDKDWGARLKASAAKIEEQMKAIEGRHGPEFLSHVRRWEEFEKVALEEALDLHSKLNFLDGRGGAK
jgi:hypothetical protein